MKYSKLFARTRHDAPSDANCKNAELLTKGAFVERLAAGIYNYLPLGKRVLDKICKIVREEMDAVEGQEILMPTLHPIELWKTTGRDATMQDILYRTEASGKEFVMGPSHEETVTPLLANYIQSYKDLPVCVYQIQTKFRNEPRAKSGLLRGREFGMKDMYSFHETEEDLDTYYEKVAEAYFNVYKRCGLESYKIEASGGAFTDKKSHEFAVVTEAGEDIIVINADGSVAQNLEVAVGDLPDLGLSEEPEKDLQEVEVVRGASVEENAKAHGVENYRILKSVVYEVEGKGLLGVLIRGDLCVNELKLEKYLQTRVRPAEADKLRAMGLVPGFISPVGLPEGVDLPFVADKSVLSVKNYITGANRDGVDLVNVNWGRDFQVSDVADLVEVRAGFLCHKTGSPLKELKAVEAGNIFKLGTIYSEAFDLNFTDRDGKQKPVIMGCYGIGTTRLIGTIVEACHDEKGIVWPLSVAPYQVHLLTIGNDEEVIERAEEIYRDLVAAGVEVLYDDRDERAGVKLNDADLIGVPLRLVLSKRTLEETAVEWKKRNEGESENVKCDQLLEKVKQFLNAN